MMPPDPIQDTAYRRQQAEAELTPSTRAGATIGQMWGGAVALVMATVTICGFVLSLKYDIKDSRRAQDQTAETVKEIRASMEKVTNDTKVETQLIRAEVVKGDTALSETDKAIQRQLDAKLDAAYLYRLGASNKTLVIPNPNPPSYP